MDGYRIVGRSHDPSESGVVTVQNERLTRGAASITLFTAVLWGGNSVAIKMALAGVPPLALAGFRFFLGGLFIVVWCLISRTSVRLAHGELSRILRLLVLFIAQIGLLNAGTEHTLAARSTVFISAYPFFTALFAHLFIPGDQSGPSRFYGMALSFSGVLLVFGESLARAEWNYLGGDLMVLASATLLGARQVYTKHLAQDIVPARLLVWQSGLSLPIFFGMSALLERPLDLALTPDVNAGILYQGFVIAGFCFLVMTNLLKRYRASQIGVYGFVTPIFGVFLSHLLLSEPLSPGLLISVVLVGGGIALANRN